MCHTVCQGALEGRQCVRELGNDVRSLLLLPDLFYMLDEFATFSGDANQCLAVHELHARSLGDQVGDLGFEVRLGEVGVKRGHVYGDAAVS